MRYFQNLMGTWSNQTLKCLRLWCRQARNHVATLSYQILNSGDDSYFALQIRIKQSQEVIDRNR